MFWLAWRIWFVTGTGAISYTPTLVGSNNIPTITYYPNPIIYGSSQTINLPSLTAYKIATKGSVYVPALSSVYSRSSFNVVYEVSDSDGTQTPVLDSSLFSIQMLDSNNNVVSSDVISCDISATTQNWKWNHRVYSTTF